MTLRPGSQEWELGWREPRGATTWLYRTPAIDLGMPSVNAEITLTPSPGRWTLLAGGPRLGPAVLFWPLLAVFAGVAVALGRFSTATNWTPLGTRQWMLLGVGLTQLSVGGAALVASWLLALGWRRRSGTDVPGLWFDAVQVGLVVFTGIALLTLFVAIQQGLLGAPEMQIAGNGSHAGMLQWYQDRAGPLLPEPWLVSVPMLAYRAAMLGWALWLALRLVGWLRWGWESFSAGELWRARRPRVAEASE